MNVRSFQRWSLSSLVVSIGLFATLRAWQWLRPVARVVPSRETTFLTSPVRTDGTVDYAAAVCDELRRGVTPENNAAPLLFLVDGQPVDRFDEAERAALPKLERPFEPLECAATEEFEQGRTKGADADVVREWLDKMREPLDLVVAAAARERYFVPFREWAVDQRVPWAWDFGPAAGLLWRAAARTEDGEFDAALDDLRCALRVVELQAESDFLPEMAVAAQFSVRAWSVVGHLVRARGRISRDEFLRLTRGLDRRPLAERVRRTARLERLFWLSSVGDLLQLGRLHLDRSVGGETSSRDSGGWFFQHLDHDRVLRSTNDWWDRVDAVLGGRDDWDARLAQLDSIVDQARAERHLSTPWWLVSPEVEGVWAANSFAATGMPASRGLLGATTLLTATSDRLLVEVAAQAYADDVGHDPATTDDLTPSIFAAPFRDRLTDSSLKCRRDASGARVVEGPLTELEKRLESAPSREKSSKPR
jgi:hypothetical protein